MLFVCSPTNAQLEVMDLERGPIRLWVGLNMLNWTRTIAPLHHSCDPWSHKAVGLQL